MTKNVFKVTGTFSMGRNGKQKFSKEMIAKDENAARELVYSLIGSKHGVQRREVSIREIKRIKPEDVEDLTVRGLLEKKG